MEYYVADARRQLGEIERKRLEKEKNRSENWQRSASVAYKLGDAYVKGQNVKASEMMQSDPSLKYSDKYMDDSWWNKIKRPFTEAENRFANTEISTEVPEIDMEKIKPISTKTLENTSVDNNAIASRSYGNVPSEYGDIYNNSQWEATQQGVNKINVTTDISNKPIQQQGKDILGFSRFKKTIPNSDGVGNIGIDVDNTGLISPSEMGAMDKMRGVGGALGKVAQGVGVAKSAYDLYKNRDGEFDGEDALKTAEFGLGALGMLGVVNPALGVGLAGGKMLYDWWEDR